MKDFKRSVTTTAMMRSETMRLWQVNSVVKASQDAYVCAVRLLNEGQVVGMPTETVYGLAADALNPAGLARIFEVKQRPLFDPLIVHVLSQDAAWDLVTEVPEIAHKLAERFWPGALTLVLPKKDIVPDLATSGLPTVALRVPAHPVAQDLLRAFGRPLAAPSANRFGRISPTDAKAVWTELGADVPLIIDGGPCELGVESTVLDLSGRSPLVLRVGGIPVEELEWLVGRIDLAPPVQTNPTAPGQLKQHYAPGKPLRLVESVDDIPHRPGIGVLDIGSWTPPSSYGWIYENLSRRSDLFEAAANFFRCLRRLDDNSRVTQIYARRLPEQGLGLAMNDRLERAAH